MPLTGHTRKGVACAIGHTRKSVVLRLGRGRKGVVCVTGKTRKGKEDRKGVACVTGKIYEWGRKGVQPVSLGRLGRGRNEG